MLQEMTLDQQKALYIRANAIHHSADAEHTPISNDQYDQLKRLIRDADPDWEPLKQAGWKINTLSPLDKCTHKGFMGSIYNAYDYAPKKAPEDQKWEIGMQQWRANVTGCVVDLYSMLKVDGLSVGLEYQNGQLQVALMRGDCIEGENVTEHILQMRDAPAMINWKGHGVVRGEVVMYASDWEEYKRLNPDAKNPRNVASGIMGRKETSDVRFLRFVAHSFQIFATKVTHQARTFEDDFNFLREQGFVPPRGRLCHGLGHVKEFYEQVAADRMDNKLPYEIDGVVVVVNSIGAYTSLGVDSGRCPKGAVAWKFAAITAKSIINTVEVTVGHNGKLTPVANLEPTPIGGVTVSRASLANFEECKRLGAHIGSQVIIARQGDVIPKVTQVLASFEGSKPIVAPNECPVCGGKVGPRKTVDGTDTADVYCLNEDECPAQSTGKINKWIKDTGIMDVGKKIVAAMVEGNLITTPADLYRLDLVSLSEMKFGKSQYGVKRATKTIDSINAHRSLPLEVFLGALGVRGLGAGVVANVREKMPGQFDKLSDWIGCTKLIDFADDVSLPNVARSIYEGLTARSGLVEDLLRVGVAIAAPASPAASGATAGPLSGKVILLTGDFPEKKKVYHEQITARGGAVEEDFTSKVTDVVVFIIPDDPSKLTGKGKKAHAKGILHDFAWLTTQLGSPAAPPPEIKHDDVPGQMTIADAVEEDYPR
jgi:DNA ligase (NAD+)